MLSLPMAGAIIILGVVIMLMVGNSAPDKPLMTRPAKVGFWILVALCGLFICWFTYRVPQRAPEMLGQIAAYVIILGIFVAIGDKMRKRKAKKEIAPPR